jgi:hypothetical protein
VSSKTRLANKTQWALKDILGECSEARIDWQQAMTRAEKQLDPVTLALLARLRDKLAEIERKATNALNGDYEP